MNAPGEEHTIWLSSAWLWGGVFGTALFIYGLATWKFPPPKHWGPADIFVAQSSISIAAVIAAFAISSGLSWVCHSIGLEIGFR